jgi:hypothetical protein
MGATARTVRERQQTSQGATGATGERGRGTGRVSSGGKVRNRWVDGCTVHGADGGLGVVCGGAGALERDGRERRRERWRRRGRAVERTSGEEERTGRPQHHPRDAPVGNLLLQSSALVRQHSFASQHPPSTHLARPRPVSPPIPRQSRPRCPRCPSRCPTSSLPFPPISPHITLLDLDAPDVAAVDPGSGTTTRNRSEKQTHGTYARESLQLLWDLPLTCRSLVLYALDPALGRAQFGPHGLTLGTHGHPHPDRIISLRETGPKSSRLRRRGPRLFVRSQPVILVNCPRSPRSHYLQISRSPDPSFYPPPDLPSPISQISVHIWLAAVQPPQI